MSEMCQREVTLADTLRKPIIPVLFEFIDWPPPGQLALIFAKLLYIDMSQLPSDSFPEDKLQELFQKVKGHVERWIELVGLWEQMSLSIVPFPFFFFFFLLAHRAISLARQA